MDRTRLPYLSELLAAGVQFGQQILLTRAFDDVDDAGVPGQGQAGDDRVPVPADAGRESAGTGKTVPADGVALLRESFPLPLGRDRRLRRSDVYPTRKPPNSNGSSRLHHITIMGPPRAATSSA
ncbi:hypothetical protein [Streptomyces sp. NPDC094149]|uniref:hypothetical protein n=1 Tax=Streptomyces sp. NPDC094149 TaxID=3155079 RepID=UPI00331DB18D